MKKLLLTAVIAVSAMAVNAQALQPKAQMQKIKASKSLKAVPQAMASKKNAPKKAVVDGTYYVRPEGSYTYGFGKDGMGYYNARVVVAPFTDFEHVNKSTDVANTTWSWEALNDPSYIVEFVNEENNFAFNVDAASGYQMPTLTGGRVAYTWGQTDNTYGDNYKSFMVAEEGLAPLTLTDPHMGPDYIGWGFLSTHFLFGDGQLDEEGVTYQCFAVSQDYPKPMSPLYVEDIFVDLQTLDQSVFLPADKELYLDIQNANGEVLYTLTATAEDLIPDDSDPYETEYGDMRWATAVFSVKDVDPLTGGVAAVPFVLDEEFTVVIYGLEGTGLGMRGHFMMDDDRNPTAEASIIPNGYLHFYNVANQEDQVSFTFQNNIAVPINFTAMFDMAQVWTSAFLQDGTELSDFNVLKVSADGKTVENAGFAQANSVSVNTASSWIDEDGNEMYYVADENDEMPEWLTYLVDNSGWTDYNPETENPDPTVYVGFEAEPLPEGVTGRGVKLYVNGRGIVSEDPIYVLQGDYTKEMVDNPAGVNSVLASNAKNGKMFTVTGQQVSKNFKGIVVKDGKKFINK